MIGLGTYQPDGIVTLTSQPIVERLLSSLENVNLPVYSGYIQSFTIDELNNGDKAFELDYNPIQKSIYLVLNGVSYYNYEDLKFFKYNEEENNLTWVFTESEDNPNGINLEVGDKLLIIYNFLQSYDGEGLEHYYIKNETLYIV